MNQNKAKVITIGTFDGLHIGHQKILKKVVTIAKEHGLSPSVLTLFPHPRMVLKKADSIKLLNTINERISLLKQYGIEDVIVKEFTKEFANLSPEEYVEHVLVKELNTKHIVIGYDHHFGKNRSANINDLINFSKTYNFSVNQINAQDIEEVTVSSTKVRKALDNGEVAKANLYLGYNYFITGKVKHGKALGRTLEFPTANIHIKEDYKLIPKEGVYIVKSEINGETVYGMMNIGKNPTVNGSEISLEVHYFNFNTTIYDFTITVEFLKRIRNEHKFSSTDELKSQLKKDQSFALDYIKTQNENISF